MADKKNTKELLNELAGKRKALYDFRFAVSGSKIKNIKEGRNIRKDIARLLTKIRAEKV